MTRRNLALAGLLLLACKSDKKEPPAEATKPVAQSAAPEKAGSRAEAIANAAGPLLPGMTRLEALQLQIKLPTPDTQVHQSVGTTYDLIMPGSRFFSIREVDAVAPKTEDDAKRFVQGYAPKALESEPLPDGWILTFQSDASGPGMHWLQVRRKIGDKSYECSATSPRPADLEPVVEACKSLRR